MSLWSDYILANSIDEALHALASAPGAAIPIAGGTDLLLDLQQGHHEPVHTLVDITNIPELKKLELRGDTLFIGAAVTVREIVHSPLILKNALAVSEACDLIGGPQVRNTATLGGNVAHALPAADGMIGLVAMDARAEIASVKGRRFEPILNLFRGPGVSALKLDSEILVGFYLPVLQAGQASAFGRVMRPQGVALPIINLAAWVWREADTIRDIRIAVGPAGPVPQRAFALEKFLTGAKYNEETLAKAREMIPDSLHFRSSAQRASSDYRYQLCDFLLEDVIGKAWKRAELVEVV